MRLKSLELKNYRSCYDTRVEFAEHVTLLVGENDAGKSTIIDALRTVVPPASGRVNHWFDTDRDLSYGVAPGATIEACRVYSDLTQAEDGFYTPSLVDPHRNLVHTTVYLTDPTIHRRHRVGYLVGDDRLPDPEPENRDRIAHVYLQPLRDAATALDSAGGNRLADVFRILVDEDEIAAFEGSANEALKALAADETAKKVVRGVQRHLSSVTRPVRHRIVDVQHRPQRLAALARSLRLHMAAEGLTPSDLAGSGLGYANLLFIATVVLELERAKEFDLLILLLEEPEAHLHPQLQTVLLSYLREVTETSARNAPAEGQGAGRIQVIATSHSPNLVSSVSTADVCILRAHDHVERDADPDSGAAQGADAAVAATQALTETVAVSLASVPLSPADRRKVDRYLDVTRAALLFARQVVLVEGIAESLILRVLAERCIYPAQSDDGTPQGKANRQLREQFRAISIVAVGGVDFMPFLRLVLHADLALVDRVAVVTDGDNGAGENRRTEIYAEFPQHRNSGVLTVCVGATTLEAELYSLAGNEQLLRAAFEDQHPRSLERWDAINPGEEASIEGRAKAFSLALKEGKLNLGKGDFAHVLAGLVEAAANPAAFVVPSYLEDAIKAAVIVPQLEEPADGTV